MNKFTPVLHSDVKEIVSSAPVKSCKLGPIPTSLLKVHIELLAPIISNVVNSSFEAGIFSDELKNALLCPLYKHPSLELMFRNFSPVSNLSFLRKIIERLVCRQIVQSTNSTGQMEDCQSFNTAYQEFFFYRDSPIKGPAVLYRQTYLMS